MKKILLNILWCIFIYSFAFGYSSNLGNHYAGNPPAYNSCVNCHPGTVNSGDGSMTILNLPTSYQPGQTYGLTLRLQDPGQSRWGFQLTVVKNSAISERGGTIVQTDFTNTRLSSLPNNGLQFLNQTTQGNFRNTMNGPVNWSFQWTAPAAGTGTVTFYAAGLAANNNNNANGDYTYLVSIPVNEFQQNLPPNPFNLTSPPNGSILRTNQAVLSWEANGGGTNDTIFYVLYLSPDSLFLTSDSFFTGTISSRIVQNLTNYTTYFWKVRAYNQRNQSIWSNQIYHFTISMPSPITVPPTLVSPENNSSRLLNTTTFLWMPAFDPDPNDTIRYSIHLSFRHYTYIYDADTDTMISIDLDTIPPLLANDEILWWVQAMSNSPISFVESDTFRLLPYNTIKNEVQILPSSFIVFEVYPNPFNHIATVTLRLSISNAVNAVLYDLTGTEVRRYSLGHLIAGEHIFQIDGNDLPSGIYFLKLRSGSEFHLRKLILLK